MCVFKCVSLESLLLFFWVWIVFFSITMKVIKFVTVCLFDWYENISRVPHQNGISQLYNMLEIHHSGLEPSIWTCAVWCSPVCPSVCLSICLLWQKFHCWTLYKHLLIRFLHVWHVWHYWPLPLFCLKILLSHLSGLDLGWRPQLGRGHKVRGKQRLLASFFWHSLQMTRMNFDVVLKLFKWNILILL